MHVDDQMYDQMYDQEDDQMYFHMHLLREIHTNLRGIGSQVQLPKIVQSYRSV